MQTEPTQTQNPNILPQKTMVRLSIIFEEEYKFENILSKWYG